VKKYIYASLLAVLCFIQINEFKFNEIIKLKTFDAFVKEQQSSEYFTAYLILQKMI